MKVFFGLQSCLAALLSNILQCLEVITSGVVLMATVPVLALLRKKGCKPDVCFTNQFMSVWHIK